MKESEKHNRIREWRKRRNLSTKELADRVGTSIAQINRMETGVRNTNLPWILRLSRALDVTPGELMTQKDNPLLPSEREMMIIESMRAHSDQLMDVVEAVVDAYAGKGFVAQERELLKTLRSEENDLSIKAEAVIKFHDALHNRSKPQRFWQTD